jgi:hypothetical protein
MAGISTEIIKLIPWSHRNFTCHTILLSFRHFSLPAHNKLFLNEWRTVLQNFMNFPKYMCQSVVKSHSAPFVTGPIPHSWESPVVVRVLFRLLLQWHKTQLTSTNARLFTCRRYYVQSGCVVRFQYESYAIPMLIYIFISVCNASDSCFSSVRFLAQTNVTMVTTQRVNILLPAWILNPSSAVLMNVKSLPCGLPTWHCPICPTTVGHHDDSPYWPVPHGHLCTDSCPICLATLGHHDDDFPYKPIPQGHPCMDSRPICPVTVRHHDDSPYWPVPHGHLCMDSTLQKHLQAECWLGSVFPKDTYNYKKGLHEYICTKLPILVTWPF